MNEAVRAQFPLLSRKIDGQAVVYLDSAATALKPRSVLEAERRYGEEFTANIHRGRHALSEEASEHFEAARRRVARFMGCAPACVVFVKNSTEGLNLVAAGLRLSKADGVLVYDSEHHSNLVPWMRSATAHIAPADPTRPYDLDATEDLLKQHRPKVFAFSLASNVTGVVQPAQALCALAKKYGALSVVDGAQGVPHFGVNVEGVDCDFLVFSGHKLMSSSGVGVLYGKSEHLATLDPLCVGGGTVERVSLDGYTLKPPPGRFEAGTPAIGAVLSLSASLDFLDDLGFEVLQAHEERLASIFEEELSQAPAGTQVLLPKSPRRLAIASVAPRSDQVSADHLALVLSDSNKMMVRSGFHCCQPLFAALGRKFGAVRASAYVYTTEDEVRQYCQVLKALLAKTVRG